MDEILVHSVEYMRGNIDQFGVSLKDLPFHFWHSSPVRKPFKKSVGFCINKNCNLGDRGFTVQFHIRKKCMYSTIDHKEQECPKCKSSLFWTTRWEQL